LINTRFAHAADLGTMTKNLSRLHFEDRYNTTEAATNTQKTQRTVKNLHVFVS
jgi:hypothetical protein